jgi:DNA-binding response OmpR family regulator
VGTAIIQNNIVKAALHAHRLAPECAALGAHSMHKLCLALDRIPLEMPDSENAKDEAATVLAGLNSEFEQVRLEFAAVAGIARRPTTASPGKSRPEINAGQPRVLLIEDSESQRDEILVALSPEVSILWAKTGAEAIQLAQDNEFELLLVDIVLPDFDGFELVKQLRGLKHLEETPVFFLSVRGAKEDRLHGYTLGAEAYIVKPFDHDELRVRVGGALERVTRKRVKEQLISKGELNINFTLQRASLLPEGGKESILDLTPLEFRILCYFARNENTVLSRDELMNNVWGPSVYVLGRTVDKHVCTLRRKLADRATYIETLPRKGYRFSTQAANR